MLSNTLKNIYLNPDSGACLITTDNFWGVDKTIWLYFHPAEYLTYVVHIVTAYIHSPENLQALNT